MPKTRSNCRKFSRKKNPQADNDGVAIFWKASRYSLANLSFLAFDDVKRNEGVVRVDLIGTAEYAFRPKARQPWASLIVSPSAAPSYNTPVGDRTLAGTQTRTSR